MTDRLKGVVVTFDADVREDDAAAIMDAIGQLRHVIDVRPVKAGYEDDMMRTRVRRELVSQLFALLKE